MVWYKDLTIYFIILSSLQVACGNVTGYLNLCCKPWTIKVTWTVLIQNGCFDFVCINLMQISRNQLRTIYSTRDDLGRGCRGYTSSSPLPRRSIILCFSSCSLFCWPHYSVTPFLGGPPPSKKNTWICLSTVYKCLYTCYSKADEYARFR